MAAGSARVDLDAQEVSWDGGSAHFEIDPDDEAPPAQRPRRDRPDAAEGRRDRRLRARRASAPAPSRRRSEPGMAKTIVTLPGDGIGPEVTAAAVEVLNALARRPHVRGAPRRRRVDRRARHRADRRGPRRRAARRTPCFLGAVGGPKWDTTDPDKPRPEQGLLGLRKRARPLREPAPGPPGAGARRREPAAPRGHRGHRPPRRPRAHRRHLLRREDAAPTTRATDLSVYTVAEIERIARIAFGAARRARLERRQGQRARDLAAVARDRRPRHADGVPRRRARARARRQRRDAARRRADALRRDPHREHVRRHPHRRGGDAHRLDRDAAERVARSARRARACSSPCTARRRTSRARAIANPLAMFLSAAMLLRHGFGFENEAAALESAVDRALDDGLRTHDLGGTATTAEATRAVLDHLR